MSSDIVELEAKFIERVIGRREEIISEAEKRAKEIIDKARETARKILMEEREAQMKLAGTDLRAVKDKVLGKAHEEGRRKVASAREEVISRVFSQVENRLRTIAEGKDTFADYHNMLSRLILEGASAIGDKELMISANERDRKHLVRELEKIERTTKKALGYEVRLIVEEGPIDCLGGVILCDRSKRKIFYNTLEGRLQKARGIMGAEVAKVLGAI